MKALKYILILILVVIIGGAIYLSLQDGSYEMEETIAVEAPKELVYNKIADLSNFSEWNEFMKGEDFKITLGEQTKGVDAYLNFEDKDGTGKLEITSLAPTDQVRMQLTYASGSQESITDISYNVSQLENEVQVQMTAYGEKDLKNKFWSALFGSDLEDNLLPKLRESFSSLQPIIQSDMAVHAVNVDGIVNTSGGYHLYITQSASLTNMSAVKEKLTATIENYMKAISLNATGVVLVQYDKRDVISNNALITVAIPVRERIITEIDSNMLCAYKEPEKAVKVILKGSHSNLNAAWEKGAEFIRANGLVRSESPAYEIYKNDPQTTINPADLITEIYLPIE
jgi:effector-binding domain-containing protein